ncbi:unnamed protein product [Sphagnum jensenii]|uniref:poly(ADP-ribose) glycohydrolase n=1 Tax=Sphagnum jensenii TaxID=128206 RepID=A0ABP0W3X0_9BRYO
MESFLAMDALLPVKREVGEGGETIYTWQGSVKYSLLALARGAFASQILSGEALFDCIRDLQLRSGLPHSRLARHASHGLALFCDDLMSPADAQVFFRSTLPQIARLALNLPALLQSQSQQIGDLGAEKDRPEMALRLLRKQHAGMVLLRQELVASLLACSFLCLFPSENRREEDLGIINFDTLFAGVYERGERNENKLRCILHYFDRVCNTMPQGSVSFERKVLPKKKDQEKEVHDGAFWRSSQAPLCPITLLEKGFIEDDGRDCLQVDFANRLLGGGALAVGCVQEEIRFMINPELIAGMLFIPAMADNESIEVVGAERYSSYEGYGPTFRFKGDFSDSTPRDTWGRRQTHIIAIDALPKPGEKQFQSPLMLRELVKAYCGFLDPCSTEGEPGATDNGGDAMDIADESPCCVENKELCDGVVLGITSNGNGTGATTDIKTTVGIATGNWGCGVFGGNLELKSLLQWLAASQAGRPYMLYFSFQDPRAKRLQEVADWILQEQWCVGELWSILLEYGEQGQFHVNLFDWIMPHPGTKLHYSQHYHKAR